MLSALLKTMRLRQWPKNGFVFFALVFDKQLFQIDPFLRTLEGFFLFCLISSAVYLLNDIYDMLAYAAARVKTTVLTNAMLLRGARLESGCARIRPRRLAGARAISGFASQPADGRIGESPSRRIGGADARTARTRLSGGQPRGRVDARRVGAGHRTRFSHA